MGYSLVVFYAGECLVTIQLSRPYRSVGQVLDAYAEQYLFERRMLTGVVVDMIEDPTGVST